MTNERILECVLEEALLLKARKWIRESSERTGYSPKHWFVRNNNKIHVVEKDGHEYDVELEEYAI